MVVRLGQTSDVEVVNSQRYRIKQGQALQLQYVSSETVTLRAWARVRYDNGEDDILFIPDSTLSNDRSVDVTTPSDVARFDGWVTDALVELPLDLTVKRGQVYVRLYFNNFGPLLCKDYCYSNFGQVALGTYIQDGPGGGAGDLEIVTLKAESAAVLLTQITLAASNTIRKYNSFVWYYVASADVANRGLTVVLRLPLGDLPTGFTQDGIVWATPTLTLTASENGILFADQARSGSTDVATVAIDDAASAPSPFPLWIEESDNSILRFRAGSFEVLDVDVIYALRESWVVEL